MDAKRDKKLLELYVILTKTNFRGEYQDAYMIELLFAMLCLDLNAASLSLNIAPQGFVLLAQDLIRIVEVDNGLDIYSIFNWSKALLTYMKMGNLTVKDINKKSTIDLRNSLDVLLDKGV